MGAYNLRARYFEPNRGVFTTSDTYEGDELNPQTIHKFTFAHQAPVQYSDPSGHGVPSIAEFMLAGAIIGVLASYYYVGFQNRHGQQFTLLDQYLIYLTGAAGGALSGGIVHSYLVPAATIATATIPVIPQFNRADLLANMKFSLHAVENFAERGLTPDMVRAAVNNGQAFWDPAKNNWAFILKGGFASGKDLFVAVSTSGNVVTLYRGAVTAKKLSNLIPVKP